jgi:glycosyltransferase involved in cell wall biosynthesis
MMAQNSAPHAELAIRSCIELVDRFVVVDGGSTDGTSDLAASLGAEVVSSPWPGDFGAQRQVLVDYVSRSLGSETVWMLIIDSDEILTGHLDRSDLENWERQGIDSVWVQRKWIVRHRGRLRYIASSPHSPDWANRLIRLAPHIRFKGVIHDHPQGLQKDFYAGAEKICLLHLDLLLNGAVQRRDKVQRYRAADPIGGLPWYNLYEDYGYWLSDLNEVEARWRPQMAAMAQTDSNDSLALQRLRYWMTPNGFYQHLARPHASRIKSGLRDMTGRLWRRSEP